MAEGYDAKTGPKNSVADALKFHLKAIYRKLGAENRRDAVRLARSRGL